MSPELSLASALPAAASEPAATTSSQHQPEADLDPESIQQAQPVQDAVMLGLRPINVIQELLQELSGQLGVVHLALHRCVLAFVMNNVTLCCLLSDLLLLGR